MRAPLKQPDFLPMSRAELDKLGWHTPDVLLVSGDAYVDHPSFAAALLGRWLVAHGYSVVIAAQPPWQGAEAARALAGMPRPRLFAGVTAGSIDSMLAHHTAFRKKRRDDAYTPGGKAGARPGRASIVYTGMVRHAFPGLPVVLGGLEASLRRVSHYDFWSDSLRRSILLDSKADVILYGMSENSLTALADLADGLLAEEAEPDGKSGRDDFRKALARAAAFVLGAVTALSPAALDSPDFAHINPIRLPSHEEILTDPSKLVSATIELEALAHRGNAYVRQDSGGRAVLLAPPPPPLSPEELERLYGLPFSRLPHPAYKEAIPAWEMIRTSITTHRGCGGGCSFCSLALHQGRRISSRGLESILAEAKAIAAGPCPKSGKKAPKWAGSISDVGGPTANMWQAACTLDPDKCKRPSCMFPKICPGFKVDQKQAVAMLRKVSAQPGVRHVRVASGVRFDLALRDMEALKAYTMDYTGGQLKVAPEHICEEVLAFMRKPAQKTFEEFLLAFEKFSHAAGKEQYVIPYLISAFPGCTDKHMHELKSWLKKRGWSPRQVQCFIPTPGTVATAMYYAGTDADGNKIHVAKSDRDRLRQHHILLDDARSKP